MHNIKSHNEITNHQIIGGKANGLLYLNEHGFTVPAFFVLDFNTIDSIIEEENLITGMVSQWVNDNNINADSLWAVRSSANMEDGKKHSFAGLFKTEINVGIDSLPNAIENVIRSYTNFGKMNYQNMGNLKFAVVVQEMIKSEYSGVAFSHNPNNIKEDDVYLNIIPGLGENLVSGREEAFAIKYAKGKISYESEKAEFKGQVYDNGLKDIALTNNKLKEKIAPYLDKIIKGAIKLSKLKKHPVDIEFTIANETIYWLQVRPITATINDEVTTIWDNANIGENYPGISLPLTISFVKYTYFNAYSGMASFLGMTSRQLKKNTPLLKNMVGGIFGGLYYNITAWQQLLYQLPFGKKTSSQITRIWAMDDAEFEKPRAKSSIFAYLRFFANMTLSFLFFKRHKKKFESTYRKVFSDYENKDFTRLSSQELLVDFHKLNKDLGSKWIVPVLNGFFAFLLFSLLKKMFKKSRLKNEYPNFVNDILYSQGDVISVVIVKEFQHLVNTILSNNDLKELFNNESEADILKSISSNYPNFKKQFNQYVSDYGERCGDGELKIETINYKEDPLGFISVLKSNAVGSVQNKTSERHFSYKKVIQKKYKYNPFKKYVLLILIKSTLHRIRDRENYRFYRTKGFDLVRKIFRAMDYNLYNEKLINEVGDSLYLELNELTNTEIVPNYKSIISKRKREYEIYRNKNPVNRYHQKGSSFIPAETTKLENVKGVLKGIACSSGIITSEVVIINSDKLEGVDISGKILAANYFEPAWINLFSKASGIISERGGLLSHTAILCRELGIPAVVGAKGILSAIQQGDIVQLNGETGEIQIINNE